MIKFQKTLEEAKFKNHTLECHHRSQVVVYISTPTIYLAFSIMQFRKANEYTNVSSILFKAFARLFFETGSFSFVFNVIFQNGF